MNLRVIGANILWFVYTALRARRFKQTCVSVEKIQTQILLDILAKNGKSAIGRTYRFDSLQSIAAFQQAVPMQTYEDVEPYIAEIALGVPHVLTEDPVQRFGVSSGSTGASKLVPYTQRLVSEFQEGIDPWIYLLMKAHVQILGGKAYWSITPIGTQERYSAGGIPIGFDDERSYFGPLAQWVLKTVLAVPAELALVQDIDVFRYTTLRFLLQERSLAWVSVWNPTFLTLLVEPLERWFALLIEDVRQGTLSVDLKVAPEIDVVIRGSLKALPRRANELERIRAGTTECICEAIWPNLRVVSCWAHGSARDSLKEVYRVFPHASVQPKGLLATEAFVSFPFSGEMSALSIRSHFFEFEDVLDGRILLAHQLQLGGVYSVVVTTSGGLYRYQLNDLIEVLGFEAECPLMRFVGRKDKVVDLFGEKLNEEFVRSVVLEALERLYLTTAYVMVAPDASCGSVAYTLYVQFEYDVVAGTLKDLCHNVEVVLRENFHYDYCRRLGQLEHCRVFLIASGEDACGTYLTACVRQGQRMGDVKHTMLHPHQYWSREFIGTYIV